MSKLPAFQFYPGDWRKDPGVQALTFEERGVWLEILCLMHESERRGLLLLNRVAMPDEALANLLGMDINRLTLILTKLLTFGVASRETETGALMNRRMVRDEEIRKIRAEGGKKGGNPRLLNLTANLPPNLDTSNQLNQNSTPSSSSSSSSSSSNKEDIYKSAGASAGDRQFVPPTLDDVKGFASTFSTPEIAEAFWNAKEQVGWVDTHGIPIRKWRPAFRNYAASARANGFQRTRQSNPPPQLNPNRDKSHLKGGLL